MWVGGWLVFAVRGKEGVWEDVTLPTEMMSGAVVVPVCIIVVVGESILLVYHVEIRRILFCFILYCNCNYCIVINFFYILHFTLLLW